jgi:hypothetical protein
MTRAAISFAAVGTALAMLTNPFSTMASVRRSQSACVPSLLVPESEAVMNQHRLDGNKVGTRWRFSWSSCPGATRYHLHVIGPSAVNPSVDIATLETTFYEDWDTHYGITDRHGWRWKVRAYSAGSWSDWSETRTFNVSDILPPIQPEVRETCSIIGRVTGPLRFTVKDDRGEPLSFRLTQMYMKSSREPERTRRAGIEDGAFAFDNLHAGAEYRVYAANFRSEPRERTITCQANRRHQANFRILGPPIYE